LGFVQDVKVAKSTDLMRGFVHGIEGLNIYILFGRIILVIWLIQASTDIPIGVVEWAHICKPEKPFLQGFSGLKTL
jgi:hypothetical protein